MAERRKYERVPVHEAVLVELASEDLRLTTISDLSEGGAFVERVGVVPGQRVIIHLRDGDADWSASLHAVVRWTSNDGAGVEFRNLETRSTNAIASALLRGRRPSHARQRTVVRSIKSG